MASVKPFEKLTRGYAVPSDGGQPQREPSGPSPTLWTVSHRARSQSVEMPRKRNSENYSESDILAMDSELSTPLSWTQEHRFPPSCQGDA